MQKRYECADDKLKGSFVDGSAKPMGFYNNEWAVQRLNDQDVRILELEAENARLKTIQNLLEQAEKGWDTCPEYLKNAAIENELLLSELAKLRRVIGNIPSGTSCRGCEKNVGTIGDYDMTCHCELFGERCLNYNDKCAACLAAFKKGNKGE